MNIDVHTTDDAFSELESEWNDLLRRSNADDIFLTLEWQSTWWDVYSPGQLHILTCRDESGQLFGIAPLCAVDGVCHIIGGEDVTDYLDLITDRQEEAAVFAAFARYFKDNDLRLNLCNIPAQSSTLTHFVDCLRAGGYDVQVEQNEVCPVIELPDSWDGYLEKLDKKQRHEIRRKMRRALGNESVIEWHTVTDDHDLSEALARFKRLMAASDRQKAEFLRNENHVAFFDRFMPIALQRDWLRLNFLKVDGEDAAAYLNFDYNNRILVYNSGLEMESFSHLSAGIVLLVHNIQHAIDNGYAIFDFLRGDETYKYHMGGQDSPIYRLIAQP